MGAGFYFTIPGSEAVVDLTPGLNVLMFAVQLLELTGIIPDPLELLLSLFSGRPRAEATIQVAQRLLHARNPVARLKGILYLRALKERDIVISASDAADQKLLGEILHQASDGLVAQGIARHAAFELGVQDLSREAQAGLALPPIYHQAAPPGFALNGSSRLAEIYNQGLDQGTHNGLTGPALQRFAEHWLFKHGPLELLIKSQWGTQPATGTPPVAVGGGQPPSTGGLPPGGQGGLPGGGGPPFTLVPPVTPPQGGDELTDCCAQTAGYLYAIAQGLQQLAASPPSASANPDTTTCCTQILQQVTIVAEQLSALTAFLTAAPPAETPALDLGAVVTALANIANAVAASPAALDTLCQCLAPHLDGIRDAIANAPPIDLTAVVEQLKRRNDDQQVPDAWLNTLLASGAVPGALSALYQGTTWEQVAANAAHLFGWLIGVGLNDVVAIVERVFIWLIIPAAGIIWRIFSDMLLGFDLGADDTTRALARVAKTLVGTLDSAIVVLFGGAATEVISLYETGIAGLDTTTDAGVEQALQILMGRAFEAGFGAHLLAMLPELAYFTKHVGLNQTAALVAEFAGFREVLINSHRPFLQAALGRPYSYRSNRTYRTTLPNLAQAIQLYARRKLTDQDFALLASSAGYNDAWQARLLSGAYRPINPRTLATMIQDLPFPRDQMREVMEDAALAPAHVNFLLDLFAYNSTKTVRNSYVAELLTAYAHGVVADDELDAALTDIGWSDDAKHLVRQRAALQRRVTLGTLVLRDIDSQVATGQISPDQGLQQLEAAGIQDWYARLQITLATTRATLHAAKLEAAAEARLARERERNLTRAAVAEFQRGTLDETGLTAALAAVGLDPTLIASIVAVESALQVGRLKLVFGLLLSPADAELLKVRIAAIETQLKKELITTDVARLQLDQLKLPVAEAHALLARWAAEIAAATKHGQLLSYLTGQPPA